MKKYPCSYQHFSRLLKSFKRIGENQIKEDTHLSKYSSLIYRFLDSSTRTSPFELLLLDLGRIQKQHPYKTHSCLNDIMCHRLDNKFWVSYTYEDGNKKRLWNHDYSDCYIVFKVYMQIGNYRKKRISRWSIKVDWL